MSKRGQKQHARDDARKFAPGMVQHAGLRPDSAEFIIQRNAPGQMNVSLKINPEIVPDKTFYADYIRVAEEKDGVSIIFGKLEPQLMKQGAERHLGAILELSFPFKAFDQFSESFSEGDPGKGPFYLTVRRWAESNTYEISDPEKLPPVSAAGSAKYAPFRVNAGALALYEDDCAADFYYLDAMALRGLASGGTAPSGLRAVLRVVMSTGLMHEFLVRSMDVARSLKARRPSIDAPIEKVGMTDVRRE